MICVDDGLQQVKALLMLSECKMQAELKEALICYPTSTIYIYIKQFRILY